MPRPPRLILSLLSLGVGLVSSCSRGPGDRADLSPAHRIISLIPSATDFVVALGARDRLVARTDYDRDARVAGLPSVGGVVDPSVERIIALKPDLVLTWPDIESPSIDVQFRRFHVPIQPLKMETLDDVRAAVTRLGRWLGREPAAAAWIRALDDTLAAVRAAVSHRTRLTVFYVVQLDPPMTAGKGTFVDNLLDAAGAQNVFADLSETWPTVALEAVARRNPDVLIWPQYAPDASWSDQLRRAPQWLIVPAARAGRVLVVDSNLFDRPGPWLGRSARTLARVIDSAEQEIARRKA
jgi:iron complex transport system substrate-binding protein